MIIARILNRPQVEVQLRAPTPTGAISALQAAALACGSVSRAGGEAGRPGRPKAAVLLSLESTGLSRPMERAYRWSPAASLNLGCHSPSR
jgi:hypothetical protein